MVNNQYVNFWKENEIMYLKDKYPKNNKKEIAIFLKRSEKSVQVKSHRLGLKKSKEYMNNIRINISKMMKINNPMKVEEIKKKSGRTRKQNFNKKNKRIYEKSIKKIPEKVEQIIIGSLLGDARLQRKGEGNACFREEHSLKQKNYLLWKMEILSKFFGKFKIYYRGKRKNFFKTKCYDISEQIIITSKFHPIFTFFYEELYPSKSKKVICESVLNKLKPLGLAVWYMDDGSKINGNKYVICVCDKQNKELIKIKLKKIFNLNCSIHKDTIYFPNSETEKFTKLIKPYIHQDLNYKLIKMKEIKTCPICNSKRISYTENSVRCKKCGWIWSDKEEVKIVNFKKL